MFEQGPQSPNSEEKKEKTYGSSLDELSDYLDKRNEEMRRLRKEGKHLSFKNLFKAAVDVYKGKQFIDQRGSEIKSVGEQALSAVIQNPGSWEDILTTTAAKTQRVVARHMSEELEKKLIIKGEAAESLMDLEEEEQRLAAMRANLEAAEDLVKERKRILNQNQKFTTMDNTDSLKKEGQEASGRRRESGDRAAQDLFKSIFRSF